MKSFILGLLFFVFNVISYSAFAQQKKYNVLFIAIDDLKPELGCYGNNLIKSPNIDSLASKGTVFLGNYCQQAVCGPTRASLLTGKRPDYTKVWDLKTKMRDINPDIVSLPQYLRSQGYQTAGIGKIYDPRCVDSDFDKPSWSIPYYKVDTKYYPVTYGEPAMGYYQLPETKASVQKYTEEAKAKGLNEAEVLAYVQKLVKPSIENADVPDHAYKDGATALQAKDILTELSKKDEPFFFAVGFARPHLPFVAPKKYWDLYKRNEMPVAKFQAHAKNSPDIAYHNSGEMRSYTDIPPLASFSDQKEIKLPYAKQQELLHAYYAAASYTDTQIGIVIKALDSLGLRENTVIVLWGDHGWHLGDHDLWCKHTNFEQATRSTLVISTPEIKSGKTSSPSEFIDVFPTVVDFLHLPQSKNLDGKSLVPVMKDPAKKVKEFSVSQYPREGGIMGYSIRTERYRYTYWIKNNYRSSQALNKDDIVAKELYDYKEDPLETVNVVSEEKYASEVKKLDKSIMQFLNGQTLASKE